MIKHPKEVPMGEVDCTIPALAPGAQEDQTSPWLVIAGAPG